MSESVDCVVIGAGVVGLACAKKMAEQGRSVIILEAEASFGSGISARNSEVIHAGIYYPPGSLKATLCVQGRADLYEYCEARRIPYRRCGKLIVASTPEQVPHLELLQQRAYANGIENLHYLDKAAICTYEPTLQAYAALYSPDTGIVDSHAYMLALLADAETAGAYLATYSPFLSAEFDGRQFIVSIGGQDPMTLTTDYLINASGLHAVSLGQQIRAVDSSTPVAQPNAYYAKGDYFSYRGRVPFTHLIYPIPEAGGLGVHLTLDLAGQARFGPDVTWVDELNYDVDPHKKTTFYKAIRSWWPDVQEERLQADYAGIRPKITGPNTPDADFLIQHQAQHSMPGLINLYGIESPGLTAALAIAEKVVSYLIRPD